MGRGRRERVAEGVYRDGAGYAVIWRARGRQHEKRFPLDAPLARLKAWRLRKIGQAAGLAAVARGGSFTRDVVRFLQGRRHRPSFKSTRAHLRPWVALFRFQSRWAIEHPAVQAAVDEWAAQGYSARELRHRVRVLDQLFRYFEPGEPTPCADVTLPKIVPARPRRVSDETIAAVALQLLKQEMEGIGRLRTAKTRARFLLLATTGMRPVQVMRTRREDFDLTRRVWSVPPAKGDQGTVVYLNDEMLEAARLFVAADAWGPYDTRSFSKTLQRNGWPKGIRPYTARHAVGQALRRAQADLGDIQDHLGHRSPATTRGFYLEPDLARQQATSARLEGRIGMSAFLRPGASTRASAPRGRKAKEAEKTGRSRGAAPPDPEPGKSKKSRK